MKNILLIYAFIAFFSFSGQAQDLSPSAEKRVTFLTRVMATELGLNESEYIKLKAMNRERIVKADEITEMYGNDDEMMNKKMLELESSFDKKFRTMLTPSQLAAYSAYKIDPRSELALSKEPATAPANDKE